MENMLNISDMADAVEAALKKAHQIFQDVDDYFNRSSFDPDVIRNHYDEIQCRMCIILDYLWTAKERNKEVIKLIAEVRESDQKKGGKKNVC